MIVRAGVAGASARRLVSRALADTSTAGALAGNTITVVAAGKAAAPMVAAFCRESPVPVQHALAVGPGPPPGGLSGAQWIDGGHPFPDVRSVAAGRRARDLATAVEPSGRLVLLLSGGASALLALPAAGLTLDDKRRVIRSMMHAGADIHALNTVRKHMSAIKGGRLAAACRGRTITLAVSDVVGDDLSVIGSGPGVPDSTTWQDAMDSLTTWSGADEVPTAVSDLFRRGMAGAVADTPKPGDADMGRAEARVIGGRADALAAARQAAAACGYHTVVMDESLIGEARVTAGAWLERALDLAKGLGLPACVLSGGETTVRVIGSGTGGRNQEFALALAGRLASVETALVATSFGTDGIDGPTDAAGAVVDGTTLERARRTGLDHPSTYLDANDAYAFFEPLGDLIKLGPTETNVGDVQVLLMG